MAACRWTPRNALKAGVDIVVATPGRLMDHMRHDAVNFGPLDVLVLDEADRMLDMGFLPDVRRILDALPPKRQTLLFSATMPGEIMKLTVRCQEFMFHCQLTSNIANRTSDGLQQLFRQQA